MKNIQEYLINESATDTVVNLIVMESGAGNNNKEIENICNLMQKAYYHCTIFGYKDGKIHKCYGYEDLKFDGPHPKDIEPIKKFMGEHLGEITLYLEI